jgi:hypothetical protein
MSDLKLAIIPGGTHPGRNGKAVADRSRPGRGNAPPPSTS